MRVGLIGYGQIGRSLHRAVLDGLAGEDTRVAAVLVRNRSRPEPPVADVPITDQLGEFLAVPMDLVVDVGGHDALRAHGVRVLEAGHDLMTLSVGALADRAFLEQIEEAVRRTGRRLLIPSGAIAGLDMISAAALAPIESVTHTVRKPPRAFTPEQLGTTEEEPSEPLLLFDGPARDGVGRFPENVNVAAAVSLSGIGLDRTRLRVYADPTVVRNTHEVELVGHVGRLFLRVENEPSDNPKTGRIVPLSVAKAIRNLSAPMIFGL